MNVIVTAIGGENSEAGAERFERDVLSLRPNLITIDYGLNDRGIGLEKAYESWSKMIQAGLESNAKILLLTPTPDVTLAPTYEGDEKGLLTAHADQIRSLAKRNGVGLVDSFQACLNYISGGDLSDILSWSNHPNRTGHEIVTKELLRWFPAG